MKVRAAVAWEPGRPLEIERIDLEGPKQGECLVRLAATGWRVGRAGVEESHGAGRTPQGNSQTNPHERITRNER